MDVKKLKRFYEELGALFNRYNLAAMTGVVFDNDGCFIAMLADPADTQIFDFADRVRSAVEPLLLEFTGSEGVTTKIEGFTGNEINN